MENAIASLVVVFIVLFSVLTLSNTMMNAQTTLQTSWQEQSLRMQDQSKTALVTVNTRTHAGSVAEITLRNTGSTKLTDFKAWDVIVQYYDTSDPSQYHIFWLPYANPLSKANQWTVQGIYSDAKAGAKETFDPGILDPGEEMVIDMEFDPVIQAGTYVQMVMAAPNGSIVSDVFKRNVPPVLKTNSGFLVNSTESAVIKQTMLETTDVDNLPTDLVYSITTPPTHGTLTPSTTFTQADINNGLVQYSNTGTGPDSFSFTVSDGQDSIGPFTTNITVNMPPTLDINKGMNVAKSATGAIGNLLLHASDPDDPPSNLTFTVTTLPTQGTISMTTFTQDDIDNARVSYTNTSGAAGADSFQFTVSDGKKTIGPFFFSINVM